MLLGGHRIAMIAIELFHGIAAGTALLVRAVCWLRVTGHGAFVQLPPSSRFLVGVIFVLLACEIGWRLGKRNEGHGVGGNISALEQSLLGLLALMVGFTFLMALTRFEARREAVLNEANTTGTTALRARLLPEPHRTASLKLLREYAQMRVDYIPRENPWRNCRLS
jgi:hypothetical protein